MKVRMFAHSVWRVAAALALAACVIFQNIPAVKGGNHAEQIHSAKGARTPGRDLARTESNNAPAQMRAAEALRKSGISFEMNQGQFEPEVKFLARAGGCNVFLTSSGAAFNLVSDPADGTNKSRAPSMPGKSRDLAEFQAGAAEASVRSTVRMKFAGASTRVKLSGLERLPGRTNYLKGNDPARWRKDIPSFARVRYESLYAGIDLVYYSNDGRLEYDLKLAPGADPAAVAIVVEGADNLAIDERGALVAHTAAGDLRQGLPAIYQEIHGAPQLVAGNYVMKGSGRVGFQVGDYDTSKALTIDPSIVYNKTFGGSGNDGAYGVAVDAQGNAYLTGVTASPDFPTTNPLKGNLAGAQDAFVMKLDPAGSPVYSTYLGGSGLDQGNGIAVDATGNAYITGVTGSSDFPLAGALQPVYGGNGDAFVSELNAAGNGLVYSTFLGGSGLDQGLGIAVDASGNAYIGGSTFSPNFPAQNAFQAAKATAFVENDAFITRLNASGSALTYSSYLGGPGFESANGIALGPSPGTLIITGSTTSGGGPGGFPTTPGVLQSSSGGASDAFVAKFNTNASGASSLVYSTFLGGNGNDVGNGVAVDLAGNAYVTGSTASPNFPRTADAAQSTLNGPSDAFVAELNPTASSLTYGTFFGGRGDDSGQAVALSPQSQSGAGIAPADNPPPPTVFIAVIVSPGYPQKEPVQPPLSADSAAGALILYQANKLDYSDSVGPADATKSQAFGVAAHPVSLGEGATFAGFAEHINPKAYVFATELKTPQYDECFYDEDVNVLVKINSDGDYVVVDCGSGKLFFGKGTPLRLPTGIIIVDFQNHRVITTSPGKGTLVSSQLVLESPHGGFVRDFFVEAEGPLSTDLAVCQCPPPAPRLDSPLFHSPQEESPNDSKDFEIVAPVMLLAQDGIRSKISPADAALNLSATVTPPDPSISLSFSQPTISPGQTVTLTVKTTNTPANIYSVRIVAKSSQRVTAATGLISVKGPAFALGFDNPLVIGQAGSSQTVQVNIVRDGGFTGNVTVSPPPDLSALRVKVKPGSVATTDTSASFRFKIKGSAPPGVYLLTFTGQDDSGGLAGGTFILVIE